MNRTGAIPQPDLSPLLAAFGALSQATRLDVVAVLLRAGAAGLPAGELAERVGVPPQTLTFHLKELLATRLLTRTREGRIVRYAVDFPYVRGLSEQFSALCCTGIDTTAEPTPPTRALKATRRKTSP